MWFSRRINVPEEPIKLHFQRPEDPYQDPWNPEDYYPWKKGAKHYIPSLNKFVECAFGECLACAYRSPKDFGFDISPPKFLEDAYPKDYYSIGAWVEEWHCVVEREGKKKNDDGTPKTFTERVLEKQAKRELKEAGYDPKKVDLPRVFGFQGYLDLSAPAWHNEFAAMYEQIERFTRDGGYLVPMYYGCVGCRTPFFAVGAECPSCGSEECGVGQDSHGQINHKMFCGACDTEWELLEHESKSLRKDAETFCTCPECGHKDLPTPLYARLDLESGELTTGYPEGGWDCFDIFDVQVTLRKQRNNDNAPARIVIDKWEFKEPDIRLFDPAHQGGANEELAKKIAEGNRKAINLDNAHAPDESDAQATILKLDNLFGRKAANRDSRRAIRYSRSDAPTEESED